VPFPPGGTADLLARTLAAPLSGALGQQVVIDNRGGAGGALGTDVVAKAAPDGTTIAITSAGALAISIGLQEKLPYDTLKHLKPITLVAKVPELLVAATSLPANNLAELIALARAKPGTLNYASSGPGSNYHMSAELLKNLTGVDIVHVPYRGSTGARQDIVGGQVQMMLDSVPSMVPLISGGNVRALAVTGKKRSPQLPDVPTMEEAGVPGYEFTFWTGFAAPAATPEPVVARLNTEINKILARPDIKDAWGKIGAEPMIMTRAQYKAHVEGEVDKWARLIKANNIAPLQ
jgi:tripartite-type tricarboxylate transporter receptor subunit TctC